MRTIRSWAMPNAIRAGFVAGAAGGIAEILWVSLYCAATGADPALVARGVTTAAGMTALLPQAPVTLGISIHMTLALMLGLGLAWVWQVTSRGSYGKGMAYALVITALGGVWVLNFFVLLPLLSPEFVHLVPYPVSLLSKLMFGLAAAEAFRRSVPDTLLLDSSSAAAVRVRSSYSRSATYKPWRDQSRD